MFFGLPKQNAAILEFYFKDCCFDTHNNYRRKRPSPCFYSQREKNEECPLKFRRLQTSPEKVDDFINNIDIKETMNGTETHSVRLSNKVKKDMIELYTSRAVTNPTEHGSRCLFRVTYLPYRIKQDHNKDQGLLLIPLSMALGVYLG
nr:hypothetical protein [Tanacetum cinerariifolium]